MAHRVVITGMGTINPLGKDVASSWDAAVAGRSAVGPITLFNPEGLLVQIDCEVHDFDPADYMEAREARRRSRFEQLASAAASEAMRASGLDLDREDRGRVAVTVSSATGGLTTIVDATLEVEGGNPRRVSPFVIPMFMSNGAAGMLAIDLGAKGPCFSVASACASGADGIGQAWLMLRRGDIDIAVTGGAEAPISRLGVACFDRLGALSRRNDQMDLTPSPFDKNRDGLVIGEGAAVLILETLEHAQQRGANILAELVGYGATADAFHITAPSEDGAGGAAAMRHAMRAGGLEADDIDYINAHGTGTDLNDLSETLAIKLALGDAAYKIPVSSTKSMTGHLMGATGALEAVFCVQAIRTGVVPPTIHLNEPDPGCDLDYVPNQARRQAVEVALSNAFGFGGHNAVLAFRAFSG
jgi:3-oxoacyl-[acyl-carrier-protein] synthase II